VGTVVLRLRDRELQRVPIIKSPTVIGREATCDVVIDNPSVSRRHATIEYRKDTGFVIFDVDSQNGLYFKGQQVRHKPLAEGDEIQLGKFTLCYTDQGGAPPNQLRFVAPTMDPGDEFSVTTTPLPGDYMNKLRTAVAQRQDEEQRRVDVEDRLKRQRRTVWLLVALVVALGGALGTVLLLRR
jgi:pSer/pThr/pTyr-binding forkhead associated (FHA) protein